MKFDKIPEFTTERLSVYLRCLESLLESGVETTSSTAMAEQFRLNSAQFRKDLAYFGQFGLPGVGYSVRELRNHVAGILGLKTGHNVIIVGAGHLGIALAEYGGFQKNGFNIVALFDCVPEKVGIRGRTGVAVYDIAELGAVVRRCRVTMAIIAVPGDAALEVFEKLVNAGVRAILNFSPVRLPVPAGVKIKSIDLSISLETLSFFLRGATASAEQANGQLEAGQPWIAP